MTDPHAPPHAETCLKREGDRATWLIRRPGQAYRTLKLWPVTPGLLLKLLLGMAQPQRLARGANLLAKAGFQTAVPLDCWRLVRLACGWRIAVELPHLPGRSALRWLEDQGLSTAQRREIARQIGKLVADLAQARLLHKDFKPSNLIIDLPAGGEPLVAVIDTVAVRPGIDPLSATNNMLRHLDYIPEQFRHHLTRDVVIALLRVALAPLPKADRRRAIAAIRSR